MKKLMSFGLGVFLLLSLYVGVSAQAIPTLDFFHGRECPHCQNQKRWLPELQAAYPDIVINEFEVWHDAENQELMQERLSALGKKAGGVPTNIIGKEVIVGFLPEAIMAAMERVYGPPAVATATLPVVAPEAKSKNYTWLLILLGGLGLGGVLAFAGKKKS